MSKDVHDELYAVSANKAISESGGGHNAKGLEFQKYWAIMHLFELEQSNNSDFLLLFEAIQDIAVLNSVNSPTEIKIYQVKKKDRGEWTWNSLTSLQQPKKNGKSKQDISVVKSSLLGKLYAAIHAFTSLRSTGKFISNATCDIPLANGGNIATSVPSMLSELPQDYTGLLVNALESYHLNGEAPPDLSVIQLQHSAIPVDDPSTYLVGFVHDFLSKRSPRHAGQARALVEALLIQITPLCTKTNTCKTFSDIRTRHGYSKEELSKALGDLEERPDIIEILNDWLQQLLREGMSMQSVIGIRLGALNIYKKMLTNSSSSSDISVAQHCDKWLYGKVIPSVLFPFFEEAYSEISSGIVMKKNDFMAHFALKSIQKCIA